MVARKMIDETTARSMRYEEEHGEPDWDAVSEQIGMRKLYEAMVNEAERVMDEAAEGSLRIFGEPVDPYYLVAFKYLSNRLGLELEEEDS